MSAGPSPADAAQLFVHLRILMGTILGLGVARLLLGLAGLMQHPGQAKLSATHLIWIVAIFLTLIHFWWWEFELFNLTAWTFGAFFFLIAYCTVLFLLCVLLFPDNIKDYAGYEDFFLTRRTWFFALFAITVVFDIVDTAIKDHTATADLEYLIQVPLSLALCAIAVATRNRRFHLGLAIVQLLYELSWIVRLFYTTS